MRLTAAILGLALFAGAAEAQEGPKVVATSPSQGAKVSSSVAELTVTFDRQMAASWSVAWENPKTFPNLRGDPSLSRDQMTVTIPIRLQPHRSYVVWLNTANLKNFKGLDGVAAQPYRLTFETLD